MGVDVRVIDEVWGDLRAQTSGEQKRRFAGQLKLVHSQATARDVISERARRDYAETKAQRERTPDQPLGQTRDEILAEFDGQERVPASAETAAQIALVEFETGMVMFFWNGTQITELDATLDLLGDNEAVFVRLVPLKGG